MNGMTRSAVAAVLVVGLGLVPHARAANPYPTEAVGDYLFACMATNGQTPQALEKCACSVDVIASILPYEQYEQAQTIRSMRQVQGGGEKMALFRETQWARQAIDALGRAQVEAEVRCFL